MSIEMNRKTWADRQGIATGVLGEVYRGVRIAESNRATVYESEEHGIRVLQRIARENYKRKNVKAVLFGVDDYLNKTRSYAVFVEDGFLREVVD